MNFDKFEVDDFIHVYEVFKDAPNEHDITFKLKPMMMLCEDWLEQGEIIAKQQKALVFANTTMLVSGTVLLGMAITETVKRYRKKKTLKHHEEEFLRKMEEDNTPVVLEEEAR